MPARATSDLRKTQDDRSLSLRERAGVRGNETQPTKTAGFLSRNPERVWKASRFLTVTVSH